MFPELYALVGLAVGLVVGGMLGRRANRVRAYARGLEQKLEEQRLAQERLAEEAQAARDELKRGRQEVEGYRGQVSEHFGDTSRLLRELTLQYRAVYEHLAEGARDLCAEGSIPLEVGLPESPLLPGAESLELDEGDATGAEVERSGES
jgi:uncharacterized membrane-anchored protein YhcB (DUF1043 family)